MEAILDQIGIERIEAMNDDAFNAGAFMRALLNGENVFSGEEIKYWIGLLKRHVVVQLTDLLRRMMIPVGLCVILRALFDGAGRSIRLQEMLCSICCAGLLLGDFEQARQSAASLLNAAHDALGIIVPVVGATGALNGGGASTALFPVAEECADVFEGILVDVGLPVCALAGSIAALGCISERCSFDRLFGLCRATVHWLLGGAMLSYTAIIGVQGWASASKDGVALKVAQSALERMIPIIGKDVSGSTGALAVGIGRLIGAVGVTGVLSLARLCAAPIAGLFASMLSIRLAGAVLEPVAGPTLIRMMDRFGSAHEMLLALCLGGALLAALQVVGVTVLWSLILT